MNYIVLSPHFDDAIFNCFSVLQKPKAMAITIFAKAPDKNVKTIWDRLCGEASSYKMVEKRATENISALKLVKAKNLNLDYFDAQYRTTKDDLDGLYTNLKKNLNQDSIVYAPLALSKLFAHPDHIIVRDIGLDLFKAGYKVVFYPDQPYMRFPAHTKLRKSTILKKTNKLSTKLGYKLEYRVERLLKADLALKKQAMHKYESQYFFTNLFSANGLNHLTHQRYELFFDIVP